jgi:DNA invertase Pin-like site-specific DNA recombinase
MENEQRKKHIKSGLKNAVANGVILGRPIGTTINRLAKYRKIVDTIKEQEELKASGQKYLSVRKTAAYFDKEKSLIQKIREDMKAEGMLPVTPKNIYSGVDENLNVVKVYGN